MMSAQPKREEASRPRVLVVEDQFLVGMRIADLVRQLGTEPVGPVPSLEDGLKYADDPGLVGAVLDINIRGGTSERIAEVLEKRGVPFFFITGYASPLLISDRLKSMTRLSKPVVESEFRRACAQSFGHRLAG